MILELFIERSRSRPYKVPICLTCYFPRIYWQAPIMGVFCYARCMAKTFFFYDLETSGLNPRSDRIMQFAGIRTDENLEPIGEPYNLLVKLNDDTLPSPDAIMVTGITPQATQADGYTEAEFSKILVTEIFTPETTVVGFNSVRFDDEFIRHLLWRNFYDPYAWAWKDGRSRWDLLDVVRMTRALRPDGIEWPVDESGKAVNKLELLSKVNGLEHAKAHDALSDVEALISVTKLVRDKQPDLYRYLLNMRDKRAVKQLANLDDRKPFVYVSGRYDAEFNKATVAMALAPGSNDNLLVYDLRYDPTPFINLSVDGIKARLFASWQDRQAEGFVRLPVKEMQYNRCPAVAPLGVLGQADGWNKLGLELSVVDKHAKIINANPEFAKRVSQAVAGRPAFTPDPLAEGRLYDGFVSDKNRLRAEMVTAADKSSIASIQPQFDDDRLVELFVRYKVRNFPGQVNDEDRQAYEIYRQERLGTMAGSFVKRLQALSTTKLSDGQQYALEELKLWFESIMPSED